MTGFLNSHGSSMGLYGQFISLESENDDDVAALENAGLITYHDFEQESLDKSDEDLTYEDAVRIELVTLDSTGIIDVNAEDNPYRDFGRHYIESDSSYGNDNYYYVTDMPSFSSNHEKRRLNYWEAEEKWFRKWRNRHSRKPANWRDTDGRRYRKDATNRWSIRHAQVAMVDAYCLEHQEYTAEDYLRDHRALAIETERAAYAIELQRDLEEYERALELSDWLDPVEPIDADMFDDFPFGIDPWHMGYPDDREWDWMNDRVEEDVTISLSPAYHHELHRLQLLGLEEPIAFNGRPLSTLRDGSWWDEVDGDWGNCDRRADNDDYLLGQSYIGYFKGLTRTNVLSRQNRAVLTRQLLAG